MTSLRSTALGALMFAALTLSAPLAAHADAMDRTARTISRVEAQVNHLANAPDSRARDVEIDRLQREVAQLERTNDAYGNHKVALRNQARLDHLHDVLARLEGGYSLSGTRNDQPTFNDRTTRRDRYQDRRANRGHTTTRRISARLDQLDTSLDTVRRMQSPRRRAASLNGIVQELRRLDAINGQQRGKLARKNDRRIDKLEQRAQRIARHTNRRARTNSEFRLNGFTFRNRFDD